ncbi:MAG: type II toxin-antitoxin system RelE/ParE family toxin [Gammaproteobacteria bacterium]|nr:MAG: type II toxin-antitoxin system RelE/ParE family toxin [Gammaproteobacteria bacterium]
MYRNCRSRGRPGCKKLSSREFYRVRQGVYRIIYEILDDQLIVHIIKVAHRSKVY